ncbi:MAG: serine hydroxymethyltransferase [Nanobdellota archaeon]
MTTIVSDKKVADLIAKERQRQEETIELIASENFTSEDVMRAQGSCLTNKYSEGYPRKRYYGGNQYIDQIEQLAIDRAKELFSAEHANVQPHSGSSANAQSFFSILDIGDTILGMSLDHGGHLTHGSKVNFSGKQYNFISYGVTKGSGRIDMAEVRRLALEHKPKLILVGYSAYSRIVDFKAFRDIADEVGAYLMADVAHFAGLITAGIHPSPFPHCDIVTTTTHKTLRGPRGAIILSKIEDRLRDKYHPKSKRTLAKRIDSAVFPGMQGGPLDHVIAGKAVSFKEAGTDKFKTYMESVVSNAKVFADELLNCGFDIVSGGTDNHLVLVDISSKGVYGKEAENLLDSVGITCNKNMIPFDTRSPFDPSGIRLGTPAMTTRGFDEDDFRKTARLIDKTLTHKDDPGVLDTVRNEVKSLCKRHPLKYSS